MAESFRCLVCEDSFSRAVWHCPNCNQHWLLDEAVCGTCYAPRPAGPPRVDAPSTPYLTIDWRHDRFRLIRVFIGVAASGDEELALTEHMNRVAASSDLPSLVAGIRTVATFMGWDVRIVFEPDHVDWRGEWVTVGFLPPQRRS